jgi:glucokinase
MNKLTIGVDIGGTRTKLGLVDLEKGEVIEQLVFSTERYSSKKKSNNLI